MVARFAATTVATTWAGADGAVGVVDAVVGPKATPRARTRRPKVRVPAATAVDDAMTVVAAMGVAIVDAPMRAADGAIVVAAAVVVAADRSGAGLRFSRISSKQEQRSILRNA